MGWTANIETFFIIHNLSYIFNFVILTLLEGIQASGTCQPYAFSVN